MCSLKSHEKDEHGSRGSAGRTKPIFFPILLYDAKTRTWNCSECEKSFELQSQLEEHVESHNSENSLASHSQGHEVGNSQEAVPGINHGILPAYSNVNPSQVSDFQQHHDNDNDDHFQVSRLEKETTQNSTAIILEDEDHSSKSETTCGFPCKLCSLKLLSEEDLFQHIVKLHSKQFLIDGQFYYCHTCQRKFTRLCSFHSHLKHEHMNMTSEEFGNVNDNSVDSDEIIITKVRGENVEANQVKIEVDEESAMKRSQFSTEETFPMIQLESINVVEYHECEICNKVFTTVKALRIHERMMHGDILASKWKTKQNSAKTRARPKLNRFLKRGRPPKNKRSPSPRRSRDEYRQCQAIIDDLKKKLSCAEKLIKKTVKNCRSKPLSHSSRKTNRNKSGDGLACKVTPSGIKIFSQEMAKGKHVTGYKPILKKRKAYRYQCVVCGLEVSSVISLKRHVTAKHVDRFETRVEPQNTLREHEKEDSVLGECEESHGKTGDVGDTIKDSVPIPIINFEEDGDASQDRMLSEQIDEEIGVEEVQGVWENENEKENGDVEKAPEKDEVDNFIDELLGITSPEDNSNTSNCNSVRDLGSVEIDVLKEVTVPLEQSVNYLRSVENDVLKEVTIPLEDSNGSFQKERKMKEGEVHQSVISIFTEIPENLEESEEKLQSPKVTVEKAVESDQKSSSVAPSKSNASLNNKDVGKRELRIVLTRVDDDHFDFSDLLFLKKMC